MTAGALVLAGMVAAPAQAQRDPEFGATVRANIARQVIDMDPSYTGVPGYSGRRSVDAMARYQSGKLKPLLQTNGKNDIGAQGGAQDTPTITIPLLNSGPN